MGVTRKITKPWALPVVLIPGTTCCAGAQPGDEVMKDRDGDSRATTSWPDDVIARCEESLSAQKRQAPSFLLLDYSIIIDCGAWEKVHGT